MTHETPTSKGRGEPSEVERIAKGLTKAQREFFAHRSGNYWFADWYRPGERLVNLGLLDRQRIGLGDRVVITPLGLAVRQHLLGDTNNG